MPPSDTVRRGDDGVWPTVDAAERLIRASGPFGAAGWCRTALLERRDAARAELAALDDQLADLVSRRRALVDRITASNLALVGTGVLRDRATGEVLQVLGWHKRIPFDDPPPEPEPSRARPVRGRELAAAVVTLLGAVGEPLTIPRSSGCSGCTSSCPTVAPRGRSPTRSGVRFGQGASCAPGGGATPSRDARRGWEASG